MQRKIKERISDAFEIPQEVIANSPKIVCQSNTQIWIENYKGIIEYTDDRVRVNTNDFVVKIAGQMLVINYITAEDLCISGNINCVEYE